MKKWCSEERGLPFLSVCLVANPDKDFHPGFERLEVVTVGRLIAVHFHIHPLKAALRPRIGTVGVLA